MHFWSEEEKEWLKEKYRDHTITELVPMFNKHFNVDISYVQMKGALKRYDIKSGRTGKFEKGQTSWNKGMKGINFGGENGKKTQFKKGQRPINYRPVGSERINVEGYVEVKIKGPGKWRLKHQAEWEKANGPIPKGHAVIFGDGNKMNFDLDNLILVSRKQLLVMNRNKLIQDNADLTRTGIIIADIYSKIGERK